MCISVINGRIEEVAEYRVHPTCSNTSWHVWDPNSDINKDIWMMFEMKHGHDPNIIFHGMNDINWADGQHRIDLSCFSAATACMENGSRLHCACKRSPTFIGGQPDVLSYDAFWGMTPAVLEPGCRCTPLSKSVRADLAQMLQCLVSSALWETWLQTARPRKSEPCVCSTVNNRHAISQRLISSLNPRARDTRTCTRSVEHDAATAHHLV